MTTQPSDVHNSTEELSLSQTKPIFIEDEIERTKSQVIQNFNETITSIVNEANTIRELSSLRIITTDVDFQDEDMKSTSNLKSSSSSSSSSLATSMKVQMKNIESVLSTLESKVYSLSSFVRDEKESLRKLNDTKNVAEEQAQIIKDMFDFCLNDDVDDGSSDMSCNEEELAVDRRTHTGERERDGEGGKYESNDDGYSTTNHSSSIETDVSNVYDNDNHLMKHQFKGHGHERIGEQLQEDNYDGENIQQNLLQKENSQDAATKNWLLSHNRRSSGSSNNSQHSCRDQLIEQEDGKQEESNSCHSSFQKDKNNSLSNPTFSATRTEETIIATHQTIETTRNDASANPNPNPPQIKVETRASSTQRRRERSKQPHLTIKIQIQPVTEEEYRTVSKNIRGRIHLTMLNAALEDIQMSIQRKYDALSSSSAFHSSYREIVSNHEYYSSAINLSSIVNSSSNSSSEPYFISETELRNECSFFRKGESTARAMLLILRSVRRIKQVIGKKSIVCYVLL